MTYQGKTLIAALTLLLLALTHVRAYGADMLQCPKVVANTLAHIDIGEEGFFGASVEMRIRPDGRPVIVYAGGSLNIQTMRLINCRDPRCQSFDDTEIAYANSYRAGVGLALSLDGRPLVLYQRGLSLFYIECGDERCSPEVLRSIRLDPMPAGTLRTLIVRRDGRPQAIYSYDGSASTPHDLVSYTCSDTSCESGTRRILLDVAAERWHTQGATAALDGSGNLAMAFLQSNGNFQDMDVRFLKCADADCGTAETRTLSSEQGSRLAVVAWMQLLEGDRPLVLEDRSYVEGKSLLIKCLDSDCREVDSTYLFSEARRHILGLAMYDGERPLMGTLSPNTAGFYVCEDPGCFDVSLIETATTAPIVSTSSLGIASDTRPLFVHFDKGGTRLRLVQCDPFGVHSDSFE